MKGFVGKDCSGCITQFAKKKEKKLVIMINLACFVKFQNFKKSLSGSFCLFVLQLRHVQFPNTFKNGKTNPKFHKPNLILGVLVEFQFTTSRVVDFLG